MESALRTDSSGERWLELSKLQNQLTESYYRGRRTDFVCRTPCYGVVTVLVVVEHANKSQGRLAPFGRPFHTDLSC